MTSPFHAGRERVLAQLGEGLDDVAKARLAEGFYYIIEESVLPTWPMAQKYQVFLPLWTRAVSNSNRVDIEPKRYIDILINSITQDMYVDSTGPYNIGIHGISNSWKVHEDPEAKFWELVSERYFQVFNLLP